MRASKISLKLNDSHISKVETNYLILQHCIRFMFHFMLDLQDESGGTGKDMPGATTYVQELIDRNY